MAGSHAINAKTDKNKIIHILSLPAEGAFLMTMKKSPTLLVTLIKRGTAT